MINYTVIADFISLVKDPDKYEAALKQLQDRQKAIDEMIALVGKAQEIPNLHAAAKLKVEKAEEEAKRLVLEAQTNSGAVLEHARKLEASAQEVSNSVEVALTEAKAEKQKASATIKEYESLNKQAQNLVESLQTREREISNKEQEVNEKLAKLRNLGL
jgi:chromosome segregation ATPase